MYGWLIRLLGTCLSDQPATKNGVVAKAVAKDDDESSEEDSDEESEEAVKVYSLSSFCIHMGQFVSYMSE